MTVTTTATPETICIGESSQLNAQASGGSGTYTYAWTSDPAGFTSSLQNPVVSPVITTRYYVDVNDGTMTKTDSVDVTVNQAPVAFAGNDTAYCSWMNKFPIEGSGSFLGTTEWTTGGDGTFDDAAALLTNYTPGSADRLAGTFTLTLTAQALAPCTGTSADDIVILIDPCTGIPDPATLVLGLQVSPNPNNGSFNLTLTNGNKGPVEMVITDATGRTVLQQKMTFNKKVVTVPVDLGKQPHGVYVVKVISDHETQTEKVVVN